jgi:hypothetical protein
MVTQEDLFQGTNYLKLFNYWNNILLLDSIKVKTKLHNEIQIFITIKV